MATAQATKLRVGGGTVWLLPLGVSSEAELLARADLTNAEQAQYATFLPTQHQRRAEWLASRILVREELGSRIGYEPSGRPVLLSPAGPLSNRQISISHTTNWAALMVSQAGRCGVDIEQADRRADRVAARMATPEELDLATSVFPENPPLLIWCAKEAAFKALGREGLDFKEEIRLTGVAARILTVSVLSHQMTLEFFTPEKLIGVCGIFCQKTD